jgi:Protein of unknown function (DUF551)
MKKIPEPVSSEASKNRIPPRDDEHWIRVGDRLPEGEQNVLIFIDAPPERAVSFAFWDRRVFWDHNWPWTLKDVQYWMELPTPPSSNSAGHHEGPYGSHTQPRTWRKVRER